METIGFGVFLGEQVQHALTGLLQLAVMQFPDAF